MKHFVAFILFVVGLCEANYLVCEIFDQSEKSLDKYCNGTIGTIPGNCSGDINPVELSRVEKLKMRGCDPNFVLNTAKQLTNLRVLDISYSSYNSLDWLDLKFNRLQIFNASHNELFSCRFSFKNTPEIVEIDLSHNNLQRHTLPYFTRLDKLKKLHLSNNDILSSVDGRYFESINLEYIDLKSNGLVSIPNPDTKKNLKELHLEMNPISFQLCTHIVHESYPSLNSLYFSWKAVSQFDGDHCEIKRMRIVKNTTVEGILVTSNGKYEMHCTDECLGSIYTFRAGRDSFENITEVMQNFGSKIHSIDLSKNFIGELNTNSFKRFIDLNELNLSETNLTKFGFDVLWNNMRISQVDISNNKLKHLSGIPSLQKYRLQTLNIGGNQIENMNEIIEHLDPSLEELDVSGNTVGNLTATTFQKLSSLQRLNMKNTNLTLPNTNPFETLQSLKFLDLSHNHLENVNFTTLSTILNNLSELTLSNCRIKNISEVIQYLGSSLLKLDLSKNFAHGLNDQTFKNLENLEVLNLSDTNLQSLDPNLFKYQQYLNVLDISDNKLNAFDLKLLPSHHPYQLNLEGNDLTELINLQESKSRNINFKLAQNQFSCLYVKQLIKTKNINLLGNSWQQKDERDCRSTKQSINSFLSSVYEKVKFW